MNTSFVRSLTVAVLATAALLFATSRSLGDQAADRAAKSIEAEMKPAKKATYPFRGEVVSADKDAVSLARKKNGPRALVVAADSLLERDGQPVRWEDLKAGETLRGLLRKGADGKEVVVKATVGAPAEKTQAASGKTEADM
jgi:hypothetical protein